MPVYAADGSYNVTIVGGSGGAGGGLTNTELRASAVPVSVSGVPFVSVSNTPSVVLNASAVMGGVTGYKVISAASTNAQVVKATPGRLYSCQFSNTNAAYRYVKFYNLGTAPVVGTSVPVSVVGIPPGGRASLNTPQGIYCSAGIAMAITTGPADTDTGAVALNEIVGSVTYL